MPAPGQEGGERGFPAPAVAQEGHRPAVHGQCAGMEHRALLQAQRGGQHLVGEQMLHGGSVGIGRRDAVHPQPVAGQQEIGQRREPHPVARRGAVHQAPGLAIGQDPAVQGRAGILHLRLRGVDGQRRRGICGHRFNHGH